MHPWKKIIRGNKDNLNTKACIICLERIQDSDDNLELKLHLFKVHSVKVHLNELVEMCTEAEMKALMGMLVEIMGMSMNGSNNSKGGGNAGAFGAGKMVYSNDDTDSQGDNVEPAITGIYDIDNIHELVNLGLGQLQIPTTTIESKFCPSKTSKTRSIYL